MININFEINNPWHIETSSVPFTKSRKILKNKVWEIEILEYTDILFKFQLSYSVRGIDHPGLRLSFGLVNIEFNFRVYDTRHWDYENDCFEIH
jgi:hypothetical protein